MPWEKTFDIDTAIDRATTVFWSKGYEATSLSNLIDAIGITKGSFYNAFGSKKALFIQAIQKYDREQRAYTLAQFTSLKDPVLAITTFFDALIEQSLSDPDKKGCLLVNTALDLPNQSQDIAEEIQRGMAETEAFFREQVTQGIDAGVIPENVDADNAAKGLLALLVGLRVLARGVFDRDSLNAIKIQALLLIGQES